MFLRVIYSATCNMYMYVHVCACMCMYSCTMMWFIERIPFHGLIAIVGPGPSCYNILDLYAPLVTAVKCIGLIALIHEM